MRARSYLPGLTSLLLGLALLAASPARAQRRAGEPGTCVEAAARVLGVRLRPHWRGLLEEGDVRVLGPEALAGGHGSEAPCTGLLVVAPSRLRRLQVRLLSPSGLEVHREEATAHAYLRVCGASRRTLRLALRARAGRGEVRVVEVPGAPSSLPDLNRSVGGCFAGGGVEGRLTDVGRDPRSVAGAALEHAEASWRRRLATRGYDMVERLEAGESQRRIVPLGGRLPRCGGLLLVGSGAVRDADLRVLDGRGREVAADAAPRRDAFLRLCGPPASRAVRALVRVARGRGSWSLWSVRLRPSPFGTERVPGAGPLASGRWTEAEHRAAGVGFRPRALGWVLLRSGERYRWPVDLPGPGRCAAFGAVPGDEASTADLDVLLVGADGRLLARDVGVLDDPVVVACDVESERGWLEVRMTGRNGRALLWQGAP